MIDRPHSGRAASVRRAAVTMVVALLLAAGCSTGNEESQATTTSTTLPASTTTTTSGPADTSVPTSTTVASTGEPPVIHLAGSTTVYSQDGQVRVSGWLDRPAEVTVGDTPADVIDGQYADVIDGGISTFETVLDLPPGSHAITIAATDARGLENEIVLSVVVDPALEMQLAMIEDVDLVARTVVADDIEFLIGDEATIAAREDGVIEEDEETPGGFYLRNRNPEPRTLTLGDPGVVTLQACFLDNGPCTVEQAVDIVTWVQLLSNPDMAEEQFGWSWYGAASSPYWLTLQDGIVVQISEQYLP